MNKQVMDSRAKAAFEAVRHLQTKDGDPMDALAAKMAKFTDEVIQRTEAAEREAAGAKAVAYEAQQMAAREGGSGSGFQAKSWGEQFVGADRLKDFAEDRSRPGRFRMDVKTTITTAAGSGGIAPAHRDGSITTLARSTPRVRDLLNVVQVTGNLVEYIAQTSRPTQAATVAEGALKPEAAMALQLRSTPTQVIAHWIPASRRVLDDSPQLRDLIDTELRFGLQEQEDVQILQGDGVSPNLHGLIPQATAYAAPITLGTGATQIDVIAAAILQNALADVPADGVVLHPSDVMKMRLLKDSEGRYILGNPAGDAPPRLWGLPIVETKGIAAGTFLVGAFRQAATLYDRWQPTVQVSTEHADFFTRNLVAILAEERIALAVKKPSALTYGSFPAA